MKKPYQKKVRFFQRKIIFFLLGYYEQRVIATHASIKTSRNRGKNAFLQTRIAAAPIPVSTASEGKLLLNLPRAVTLPSFIPSQTDSSVMNSGDFFNTDSTSLFNDSTSSRSWPVYKLIPQAPFINPRHKPKPASRHASGASTSTFFPIPNNEAFYLPPECFFKIYFTNKPTPLTITIFLTHLPTTKPTFSEIIKVVEFLFTIQNNFF